MVTMLAIMKDTDDHFEKLNKQLEEMRSSGKPNLVLIKGIDKDKQQFIITKLGKHPGIFLGQRTLDGHPSLNILRVIKLTKGKR